MLFKKRTKLGKTLDSKKITQEELKKKAKISHQTASKLCNDTKYKPTFATIAKVKKALKELGLNDDDKFFPM